jgi:hypothetical protein
MATSTGGAGGGGGWEGGGGGGGAHLLDGLPDMPLLPCGSWWWWWWSVSAEEEKEEEWRCAEAAWSGGPAIPPS